MSSVAYEQGAGPLLGENGRRARPAETDCPPASRSVSEYERRSGLDPCSGWLRNSRWRAAAAGRSRSKPGGLAPGCGARWLRPGAGRAGGTASPVRGAAAGTRAAEQPRDPGSGPSRPCCCHQREWQQPASRLRRARLPIAPFSPFATSSAGAYPVSRRIRRPGGGAARRGPVLYLGCLEWGRVRPDSLHARGGSQRGAGRFDLLP